MKPLSLAVIVVAAIGVPRVACADEITLVAPGGIQAAIERLIPGFERATGHTVKPTFGSGLGTKKQVADGVPFDVPIIQPPYPEVVASGHVVVSSATPLARVAVGVAVRTGARKPDISTPDAVKRLLLSVKSFSYPDPAGGAAAGVSFTKTLEQLGIADEVKPKIHLARGGAAAMEAVAKGDVEIGLTFVSEILTEPGVEAVGPLPEAISTPTSLVAFVSTHAKNADATRALVRYLSSADAADTYRKVGMQPRVNEIVGVGNFSHIVASMDKSLAFYRDVLGLEVTVNQPFSPNPAIMKLGNTPGAQSRFLALKVPGSDIGVELIEYKDIDRKPQHPKFVDPGAANIALRVRDINSVFEKLRKAGATILTKGGKPATINNGAYLFVQDPDGFVVELSQGTPPANSTVPATSNVFGAAFETTVADSATSVMFYSELLGLEMPLGAAFNDNQLMAETAGAPGASFRQSGATIPGTTARLTLIEFKNIPRTPLKGRVQDPGTAILQLTVRDVAALTARLKAAGVPVVTTGGMPVDLGNNVKIAIVRSPDNLLLELVQR